MGVFDALENKKQLTDKKNRSVCDAARAEGGVHMKPTNGAPHKREPFKILTIIAAAVAGLLLLDAAVPIFPREAITALFTGGKGDNTNPSGEVVTRPLSLWDQLFGRYDPDDDLPMPDDPTPGRPVDTEEPVMEDDPWLGETEPPIVDIPDMDLPVSVAVTYLDRATVRGWKEPIMKAMEAIKRQYEKQGVDIIMLGLFDFGLDGTPEIVVTTYEDSYELYPMYELMVYDLTGNPLFVLGNGDLSPLLVYAQRGPTYPCITAYFHQYSTYEGGVLYSEEQMIRVLDDGGKCSVLYGVTQVGERYSYMANDILTSKDGWYGAMETFENQYEALGATEMLWFGWPFGMDAEEIAELMVSSDQRFVQLVILAYTSSTYPEGK